MKDLLVLFVVLNIVNVIMQTVKSICTIKCGKLGAAIINALAYGLYTIVTVYMMCELPLMLKALVVALCNLVGVYVVKFFEEKARKDKIWKIEVTTKDGSKDSAILRAKLISCGIPYNYDIIHGGYATVNIYCYTQEDSAKVKKIFNSLETMPKYFVTESKNL